MKSVRLALTVVICWGAIGASCLVAADWPQWRGPHRDGVSQETGLLEGMADGWAEARLAS